jgi:hypothetical protein
VDLIFSHINNGKRKALGGKSPYELFAFIFGESVASLLGIRYINAEEVIQDRRLLLTFEKTPPANSGNFEPGVHS